MKTVHTNEETVFVETILSNVFSVNVEGFFIFGFFYSFLVRSECVLSGWL